MRNISIGSDPQAGVIETAETHDFVTAIYPIGVQETLTATTPVVSLNCYLTDLDSNANATVSTLADGTIHGQMKLIQASVVDNTTSVTLASPESASLDIITFTIIGDRVLLIWYDQIGDGTGYWKILARSDTDGDLDTPTVA